MRLLLDTHAFIWWDSDPNRLSQRVLGLCQSPSTILLLSVASVWEMQIKQQLGKLQLRVPLAGLIAAQQQTNGLELLPIELDHVLALDNLPLPSRNWTSFCAAAAFNYGNLVVAAATFTTSAAAFRFPFHAAGRTCCRSMSSLRWLQSIKPMRKKTMSETRDLSYYSSLPYAVRVYREPDGSGFTAEIPDLPGYITCADTLDEVWALIDDAKRGWRRPTACMPRGPSTNKGHEYTNESCAIRVFVAAFVDGGCGYLRTRLPH